MPFDEARAVAHTLGLTGRSSYYFYVLYKYRKVHRPSAEGQPLPETGPILPYRPDKHYADAGWVSWDDFVGNHLQRQYVPPLSSPSTPAPLHLRMPLRDGARRTHWKPKATGSTEVSLLRATVSPPVSQWWSGTLGLDRDTFGAPGLFVSRLRHKKLWQRNRGAGQVSGSTGTKAPSWMFRRPAQPCSE